MNRNIRFSENIQGAFDRWFNEHSRGTWRADRPLRYESTASSATASDTQYTYLTTSATFDNPRTQWIDTGIVAGTQNGLYGGLYVDDLINYERDNDPRYWEWSFDPVNMTYTARWEGKDDDFEPSEELDAFLESYKIIKEGENRE